MKHLFLFIAAAFIMSGSLSAQELEEVVKTDGPKMEFESSQVTYGSIDQHSDPLRKFNFTNTGTEPLVITAAKGSCGCTVPSYPKEPILPGATGEIEVRYDTKRIGAFTKSITLTTNAVNNSEAKPAGTFLLTIKGIVKAKEAAPGSSPTIIPIGKPE
ncbi:MAG: DUF1573 domain-containing protein [Bacteroidetes bacterium]|nr:DUF1573 domain-containing protein [Bacteroidota bacterium]